MFRYALPILLAAFAANAAAQAPSPAASGVREHVSKPLDASAGQYWSEYDLRPYTEKLSHLQRPEQAVIDWIVRQTGTDLWFRPPMGVLHADRQTLSVYHTAGVHEQVAAIHRRLVDGNTDPQQYTVRLILVGSPSWRTAVVAQLRAVDIGSPGLSGWLLPKEQTAMLLATLRGRSDTTELPLPPLSVVNGQEQSIVSERSVPYVTAYERRDTPYPVYVPRSDTIPEGYRLKFSPLLPADEGQIEMVIDCHVTQVERLNGVDIDLPLPTGVQRLQVAVPQVVKWSATERLVWPANQTLVLSCGVVAPPATDTRSLLANSNPGGGLLGLGKLLPENRQRADALLMIEYNGHAAAHSAKSDPAYASPPTANTATTGSVSRGRY